MSYKQFEYESTYLPKNFNGWEVLDVNVTSKSHETWYGRYLRRGVYGELKPVFIILGEWNPDTSGHKGFFVKTSRYANPSNELYRFKDFDSAKERMADVMKRTENALINTEKESEKETVNDG